MSIHHRWDLLRRGLAIAAIVLAVAGDHLALAQQAEPIQNDAVLEGKEIIPFVDDGENGSIVLGGFRLVVGDHTLSGRDAVVWVRTATEGNVEKHAFIIYVEGDVQVNEPGGITRDKIMLTVLQNVGRFTTKGTPTMRPDVKKTPLYLRATAAREDSAAREAALGGKSPVDRTPPPLIQDEKAPPQARRSAEDKRPPAPAPAGREAPPAPPQQGAEVVKPAPAQGQAPRAVPRIAATGPANMPKQPVHFYAKSLTSVLLKDNRRMTVARGDVYIAQGNPDSAMFLELQSNAAVIISRIYGPEGPPQKEAAHPGSPKVSPTAREGIEGVYLEGDVTMSRGNRFMRGETAYYDFTSDRAIIPNVVFRTIQQQRNIPIYVRAGEMRMLSSREMLFKDARVSTSDFYTPTYHMGARRVYMLDTTPYDDKGQALGEQRFLTKMEDSSFSVRGVPLLYWPYMQSEAERSSTALRRVNIGRDKQFGFGLETQWHLFRMLGLIEPEGLDAMFNFNIYQKEITIGAEWEYDRPTFSGYGMAFGTFTKNLEQDFGTENENIEAQSLRGRLLERHKQTLPDGWLGQFEIDWLSDRNYYLAEFPDDFYAGKESETLLYALKQRDNWALTALLQARLNKFQTQTESYPDMSFYLLGQPLADDRLTYFSESHAGVKRWLPDEDLVGVDGSSVMARGDTRNEINLPLRFGNLNAVPYLTTRFTGWSDAPEGGENFRPLLEGGSKFNTHIWSVDRDVRSRFWDVNGLKHIITPEAAVWGTTTAGVRPDDLFPMDPGIETGISEVSGGSFAVNQLWQTKRGGGKNTPPATVDWMRLNVIASAFSTETPQGPGDGRFFMSRPENSIGRNNITTDYTWYISDSTTFMADMNYDVDSGEISRSGVALAIQRDPRLKYFVGMRTIEALDSNALTVGATYQINRKYSASIFEQYDFGQDENSITGFTLTRKMERWNVAFNVLWTAREDDLTIMLTFWPEGIPEAQFSTGRLKPLNSSSKN
ncbi:MAG: hypothetical protein LLG01_04485 [Planctomycetaceae bacterium]|nr:hypothetical protein [Planctomycetaceae bacterium]